MENQKPITDEHFKGSKVIKGFQEISGNRLVVRERSCVQRSVALELFIAPEPPNAEVPSTTAQIKFVTPCNALVTPL